MKMRFFTGFLTAFLVGISCFAFAAQSQRQMQQTMTPNMPVPQQQLNPILEIPYIGRVDPSEPETSVGGRDPEEAFRIGSQMTGSPSRGSRPLLAIALDYQEASITRTEEDLNRMMHEVGAYFRTISHGNFEWNYLGLYRYPLRAPRSDHNNMIIRAVQEAVNSSLLRKQGITPTSLDIRSHPGRITGDELQLVIFTPWFDDQQATDLGCIDFVPSDSASRERSNAWQLCQKAPIISQWTDLSGVSHELVHSLGIGWDMYNDYADSNGLTVMSGAAVHLDPINKLLLGWYDHPQIYDLQRPGSCVLQKPVTASENQQPILLFDSSRGTDEFFLIEYRKREGIDRAIPDEGVAIWHAKFQSGSMWPYYIAGQRIYPGGDYLLASRRADTDIFENLYHLNEEDAHDTIAAGEDRTLESTPLGDDFISHRQTVFLRGVPSRAGMRADFGGNRLWKEAQAEFRLDWIDSPLGAPAVMRDTGVTFRVGFKNDRDNNIAIQWWQDGHERGENVDTDSLQDCLRAFHEAPAP